MRLFNGSPHTLANDALVTIVTFATIHLLNVVIIARKNTNR